MSHAQHFFYEHNAEGNKIKRIVTLNNPSSSSYACDSRFEKAKAIAKQLINEIYEANEGSRVAVLSFNEDIATSSITYNESRDAARSAVESNAKVLVFGQKKGTNFNKSLTSLSEMNGIDDADTVDIISDGSSSRRCGVISTQSNTSATYTVEGYDPSEAIKPLKTNR
ncbi:MAG: vWA domain-containing protein [Lachnospiraceae bacterium]